MALAMIRAGVLAAAFLLLAVLLTGCGTSEPKIITVAVMPDKPPVPSECKALARAVRMPRLAPDPDGSLPMSRLEDGWVTMQYGVLPTDGITRRRCLCWLVAAHGTERDVTELAGVCREGEPVATR